MTAAASHLRRNYDSVDIAASYFADDINQRLKKKIYIPNSWRNILWLCDVTLFAQGCGNRKLK